MTKYRFSHGKYRLCSAWVGISAFDSFQPKVWSSWGGNTETLSELWIGLLRFYTEEFQFDEHVICIRQHEKLTRFQKLWNGKRIAIEGAYIWRPFDVEDVLKSSTPLGLEMDVVWEACTWNEISDVDNTVGNPYAVSWSLSCILDHNKHIAVLQSNLVPTYSAVTNFSILQN